jgi:DNA-binding transcriptional LysR family regulator
MNWRTFDLNLLVVFDGVMQDRSVTRAGRRLGMSQPALSHALNRLRDLVHDPLFVRTPNGMVPTPRAEQLAGPIRQALADMAGALAPEPFVPAQATRRFALAVNNYAAIVLVPPLVTAVAAAAPGVHLDVRPSGTLDVLDRVDVGELDLAIGGFDTVGERFGSMSLLEDRFVCVMRQGHPNARKPLSAAALRALSHVAISSTGDDIGFLDQALPAGPRRRIAVRVPYLSAAAVLAQSDLVATLCRRVAQALTHTAAVQVRALPFSSPIVRTALVWHRRFESSPAHRWLRDLIVSVARRL